MTHTDLKPCPWCQHDPYPDPQCMWSDAAKRQIWCENCDASGPVKDGDAEAITAWNTQARTPDTAPRKPFCETCGKEVAEVLCPTCAKWWADNPPPAPSQSGDLIAEAEAEGRRIDASPIMDGHKCLYTRLATALRVAEAENARLREYPTWVMEQEKIVKPWIEKFFGLGPHLKGPTHVDPLPIHAIWGFFGRARRALGGDNETA